MYMYMYLRGSPGGGVVGMEIESVGHHGHGLLYFRQTSFTFGYCLNSDKSDAKMYQGLHCKSLILLEIVLFDILLFFLERVWILNVHSPQ